VILVGDVEVVTEVGVGSGYGIVAVAAGNAAGYNVAFGHVVVVVRELQVS
jgi:hypothetical protein